MFEHDISLAQFSNFKIGGRAAYFFQADSAERIITAAKEAKTRNLPIFVLGGATNILINDAGFNGLVLHPILKTIRQDGDLLIVGAGATIKELLDYTIKHELSGLEWAGGLPGSVGGAIFGNAGAFGGEIKDTLVSATSIDLADDDLKMIVRTNKECLFNYRSSIFKTGRLNGTNEVIVEATFRMQKGSRENIEREIEEKRQHRRDRQPLEYPNIGSIFKNIPIENVPEKTLEQFKHKIKTDPFPVLPNAVLVDAAGLKKTHIGGAEISQKHPNFIINTGNATARDVKALIVLIKTKLKEQFGVELEQEVIDL